MQAAVYYRRRCLVIHSIFTIDRHVCLCVQNNENKSFEIYLNIVYPDDE